MTAPTEEADFSGTYDRWVCPACTEVFEVEHPSDKNDLQCDACGWRGTGASSEV